MIILPFKIAIKDILHLIKYNKKINFNLVFSDNVTQSLLPGVGGHKKGARLDKVEVWVQDSTRLFFLGANQHLPRL